MTGTDRPRRFPYPIGTVVRAVDTFGRSTTGEVTACPNAFDIVLDGKHWPASLVVEVISSPDDDLDLDFLEDFDL
ncbi:hypothetical protein [Xanthobacter flavus]|uniref:hypothetical protein n=1 Tax=Xanthobacter flavus TaxID=281 RepID=UPI00372C3809